jgi:hypothetical protein
VAEVATRVLGDAGLRSDPEERPPGQDIDACRAFETYLRSRFTYTLDTPAARPGMDPIAWFLTEGKRGHCEYFASAMAGMCRSVGINARVIAGYVAGEFDAGNGAYIVRESNAHAWVEAEVARNVWITFDPTPQDTLRERLRTPTGLLAAWNSWLDSLNAAWSSSVVSFDEGTRRKLLGFDTEVEPTVRARLDELTTKFRDGGWQAAVPVILGALWRTAVAIAVAMVVLRGGRALIRRLWGALLARLALRTDPGLARALEHTGFYARALALARRRGHAKPSWRPPLEHARVVRERDHRLADALALATGLYYRARFGRHAPSADELGAVHRALDEAARL